MSDSTHPGISDTEYAKIVEQDRREDAIRDGLYGTPSLPVYHDLMGRFFGRLPREPGQ